MEAVGSEASGEGGHSEGGTVVASAEADEAGSEREVGEGTFLGQLVGVGEHRCVRATCIASDLIDPDHHIHTV